MFKLLLLSITLYLSLNVVSNPRVKNGFDLRGSEVSYRLIYKGGPPKDGIPALTHPKFIPVNQASFLNVDDRVLVLKVGEIVKIYPLKIMDYHEVVNDSIGGVPVLVTYCPLCGSGVAFSRQLDDIELTFGVSGLLYNSDVLLYDQQSQSLWSQIAKRAISGPLKGKQLQQIDLVQTSWGEAKDTNRSAFVLYNQTGFDFDYSKELYKGYKEQRALYFPVRKTSSRFHPKELVLGLEFEGSFMALPYSELAKLDEPIVTVELSGRNFAISFNKSSWSAKAFQENGQKYPSMTAYWFAWFAFHPETEVFEAAD